MKKKSKIIFIFAIVLILIITLIGVYIRINNDASIGKYTRTYNKSTMKKSDNKGKKTENYESDIDGDGDKDLIEITDEYQGYIEQNIADASEKFVNHKYTIKTNGKKIGAIVGTDTTIYITDFYDQHPGDEIVVESEVGGYISPKVKCWKIYIIKNNKITHIDEVYSAMYYYLLNYKGIVNGSAIKDMIRKYNEEYGKYDERWVVNYNNISYSVETNNISELEKNILSTKKYKVSFKLSSDIKTIIIDEI